MFSNTRLRVEGGQEAAHDHVVDAALVVIHLVDGVALSKRRDDRVVVCDLLVLTTRPSGQGVEPVDVGRRGAYSFWPPTSAAIGLISGTMSLVMKRELVRG